MKEKTTMLTRANVHNRFLEKNSVSAMLNIRIGQRYLGVNIGTQGNLYGYMIMYQHGRYIDCSIQLFFITVGFHITYGVNKVSLRYR